MRNFTAIPIQYLTLIFGFISKKDDSVFWIRDCDYQKQIYVSPSYETIWGYKTEELYKHPQRWMNYLISADLEKSYKQLISRCHDGTAEVSRFIIQDSTSNKKFIEDVCFPLFNGDSQQIAVCGLGRVITEMEWEQTNNDRSLNEIKQFNDIAMILTKELDLDFAQHSVYQITDNLSCRQRSILSCILKGQSSKETAKQLHVSPRTVEHYIEALKEKFNCRTTLQLISEINQYPSLIKELLQK